MAANPYPPVLKPEDFYDVVDPKTVGHPRAAHVARTAEHASPQHFNRLVAAKYGVMYVQIEVGGKTTKSHNGGEEADGADDVYFAPGVEQAKLKYKIYDPYGAIEKAELEVFDRFNKKPLWSRELTEEERKHGEHTIDEFNLEIKNDDGTVKKADKDFPDHVLTAEHSPYKIRIAVKGKFRMVAPCAWTYIQVLIHDIALELGPENILPATDTSGAPKDGDHRFTRKELAAIPAEGETKKVVLLCNVFKTDGKEMYNDKPFDLHKKQWGDGPQIPIFAKLRVKKSDGTAVDAPKGLGRIACMWEFKDVNEDTTGIAATPASFITDAVNYLRGSTKPPGDNCHGDRGGKRDKSPTSNPVFPKQKGYDPKTAFDDEKFPFEVDHADNRKWCALSYPWTSGAGAGKTGVMFRPSRMAGDAYQIVCALAWEKDKKRKLVLDDDKNPALPDLIESAVQVKTGTFEVWKRHQVQKYAKKKGFANSIAMTGTPSVSDYYSKAKVDFKIEYAAIENMDAGRYNAQATAWRNGLSTNDRVMVDPAVDQHATGDCCVNYRTYNAFKTAMKAAKGWSDAQLNTWLANAGSHVATSDDYTRYCSTLAFNALSRIANEFMDAAVEGIQIFHWVGMHNIDGGGTLNGWAVDLDKGGRQRCGFITCAGPTAYSGNSNSLEQTTSHEIGHHLFMPHAPDGVDADAGPEPKVHDSADTNCTMSYNFAAERRWCGFCTLRLRGWTRKKLDRVSSKNRKN